ncbi:MAG: MarR family transcriptional regulator [Alphaproteobacteria bacterium]|nr:MAG: MarR family transcriptional regulator [Alphaproteobacteria bacterium]
MARKPLYDPSQSLGFLISDVTRLLRQEFNRRAQGLGLSQAQWRALVALARQEGANQKTLAEALEIQPMTLARLIDHLQGIELVERRPDPSDRRAFCLFLTDKGQSLMEEVWQLAEETRDLAQAGVSEAELKAMTQALEKMKANLLKASPIPEQVPAPLLQTEIQ